MKKKRIKIGRESKLMITIRIDPDRYNEIKRLAGATGISQTEHIENAIGDYYERIMSGEIELIDKNGDIFPIKLLKNYKEPIPEKIFDGTNDDGGKE